MLNVPLVQIVEGVLLAAGRPLTLQAIAAVFEEQERPTTEALQAALAQLANDYAERGMELLSVAQGYTVRVRAQLAPWVSRLWEEKPARYSRALLETLAIIAYRQPVTRGDIESIRGVAVNPQILKTLHEREWIRVVGHKDVPGKPELLATTKSFLSYFNLPHLEALPPLPQLLSLQDIEHATDTLAQEGGLLEETSQECTDVVIVQAGMSAPSAPDSPAEEGIA